MVATPVPPPAAEQPPDQVAIASAPGTEASYSAGQVSKATMGGFGIGDDTTSGRVDPNQQGGDESYDYRAAARSPRTDPNDSNDPNDPNDRKPKDSNSTKP